MAQLRDSIVQGSLRVTDTTYTNDLVVGDLTAPTIKNGDYLLIADADNGNKILKGPTFDGSTATQALTKKGTWATFNNYSHPTGDGNLHVPTTGTGNNGKFLKAGSTAGSISWSALPTASTGAAGIVKLDSATGTGETTAVTPKGAAAAATAAINTLDVSDISGFGTGKTLKTLTQTNGKIAATFQDISIGAGAIASGTLGVARGGTGVTTTEKIFATYGVEYIEGTQTASTGAWTGVTKSSALYVGKTIAYKLPYAGNGNATLELTLTAADGTTNTTTGAKAVYAGNTRLTTHYPANTIMVMVWNGTDWRTNAYYNTNDDYRCRQKVITDDKKRSLLLADPVVGTADNNTLYVARRNDSIYAVASTGTIHATAFNGSTAAFSGTTASTSTSTGAVTVSGGLGVAGQVTAARIGAGGSNTSYALYANGATLLNGKLVGSSSNYGATLPSSGQTTGQIFFQTSNPVYELPVGGTTGQALVKASNTNRDVKWGGPYLPLTGGTVSGLITMSKASSESWYIAERTGSNSVAFGVGYGGVNRGVYDMTLAKWIIYCDGTNASSQLKLYGAVWNDYAEFRKDNPNENLEAGRCVSEIGDGSLRLTQNRLELGCEIVSDTFGFAIGQDKENGYNTPIASSGRVLAYPFEGIEDFRSHIGWPVCSGPNGTVSIMTKEEEHEYPSRIIGTISEIPSYNEWGTDKVKVNGRVWIRIR